MLLVAAALAFGSTGAAAPDRQVLVYASARLVYEHGGPRVDQMTDLLCNLSGLVCVSSARVGTEG